MLVFWLPFALAAVALLTLSVLARVSARRDARRVRAELERLRGELDAGGDGVVALVEGILVVDGDGCAPDVVPDELRSDRVAATTRWLSRARLRLRRAQASATERAARLRIDTAEGSVLLEGPVTVASGSRLVWSGATIVDPSDKWFEAMAALRDGDSVMALGVRHEVPDSSTTEDGRGAVRAVLAPAHSLDGIRAAAMAAPRVSLRLGSVARHPAAMVAAALALVSGALLALAYGEAADHCADCDWSGECHVALDVHRDGSEWKIFGCAAHADAECARSLGCRLNGQCSVVGGRCVAKTRQDCAHTTGCRDFGACAPVDGSCKPATDEDCRAAPMCGSLGWCSLVGDECRAAKDDDCQQSSRCASGGECSAVGGDCVRAAGEGCTESRRCVEWGACSAVDGSCVATKDEACRRSVGCLTDGKCTAVKGECRATKNEDCLRSVYCRIGKCKAENGECVEDKSMCDDRLGCCAGGGMTCDAKSDQDCAASRWCKEGGQCKLLGGECAASCATTYGCREGGRCSPGPDHSCLATSNADCRASVACKSLDWCTAVHGLCQAAAEDCQKSSVRRKRGERSAVNGKCAAASDEDCRGSDACRVEGECTARGGGCVVGKVEDCRQSLGCRANGRCFFDGQHCVEPKGEDCALLPACRELGACGSNLGRCAPKTTEHCEKSALCEKYGWCSLVRIAGTDETCFIPGIDGR